MEIEKVYQKKEISYRAKNVCIINKLYNLSSILNYYNENKSFKKLKYCGAKSNKELISLCIKNQELQKELVNITQSKSLDTIIYNLTDQQLKIVNYFVKSNIDNLTNRSRNALYYLLNNNIDIYNIYNIILSNKKFKFFDCKKIGAKSANELTIIMELIKDFIFNISEIPDKYQINILQNKYSYDKNNTLNLVPHDILETKSIFRIVNYLIEKDLIFNKKQNLFFQTFFKIRHDYPVLDYESKKNILKQFKFGFNHEKHIVENNLKNKFSFIKKIDDDLLENYQIDIKKDYLYIDEEIMNQINKKNGCIFSKGFITFLISIYTNDRYNLIGNINDVLILNLKNSRIRYKWKNLYLVEKDINNEVDFIEFFNEINFLLNEKNKETYKLNLRLLLSKFLKTETPIYLDKIIEISKFLIINEFGLSIDIEDNITILKNSEKPVREYSKEALIKLGKPSKINEITKKIKELHPNYNTSDNKVRASLRGKYGFVPIGRTSVFGLKEWEESLENFKGGTIRNIVYEYLKDFEEPKHINEILTQVLKYRPKSNKVSIISNLKLDKSKKFLFFRNSYIGLSNSKNSHFQKLKDKKMTI